MGGEESGDLGEDSVEMACLSPARSSEGVAMHWVAGPGHGVTRISNGGEEGRKCRTDLVGAHARNEGEAARNAVGVLLLAQRDDLIGSHCGTDLAANRITNSGEEVNMCSIELASSFTDPKHVRGAVVPIACE